jgi:xylulose-5-phosphate/fructose-6-phosphate phosphoketolase
MQVFKPGLKNELSTKATLDTDSLAKINAYWRAANYLSVGQIYLYNNPLLKQPLKLSDVKPLVVGEFYLRAFEPGYLKI